MRECVCVCVCVCVCLPVRVCSRVCVGQRQTELPWLTCPVTSRQQERSRNKSHGYKAGFRTHVNQRPIIQSEPMILILNIPKVMQNGRQRIRARGIGKTHVIPSAWCN